MPKFALLPLATLLTASACGAPYQPCESVRDCDPQVADACVRFPGSGQGICTLICQMDDDCPDGPEGEKATCRDIGKAKVCALP